MRLGKRINVKCESDKWSGSFLWEKYDNKIRIPNLIKKNYLVIKTKEGNVCPDCGSKLKVRDSKKRIVRDISGEEYLFSLRRFICVECGKVHTEIPDCIVPHKRYFKDAIEAAVDGKCDYYIMDDSTIYRWTHPNCNDIVSNL